MSLSTLINDHKSLMVVASMFEHSMIGHWLNGVNQNYNNHYQSYLNKIYSSTIEKNKIFNIQLFNKKWHNQWNFNYKNRLKLPINHHQSSHHQQLFTLNSLFILLFILLFNSYLKNFVQAINLMHNQTANRYLFTNQHLIRSSLPVSHQNNNNNSNTSQRNNEQNELVQPVIKILTNDNISNNNELNAVLLILPLRKNLWKTLPNLMNHSSKLSSKSISLFLTANILDFAEASKQQSNERETSSMYNKTNGTKKIVSNHFVEFWSPNFIFTKQLGNNKRLKLKNNKRHEPYRHETIEMRSTNQSEYYNNKLIDDLLFRSTIMKDWNWYFNHKLLMTNHDHFNGNNKLCQLFTGFIIESNINATEHLINHKTANYKNSSATITICNDGTMNGLVSIDYGHLILENAHQNANQQLLRSCPINREQYDDHFVSLHFCPLVIKFMPMPEMFNRLNLNNNNRNKRSYSSERTIEILVVTDLSMYIYHENSLRNYVFTLMAMVSHLFKHSSIGNEINIKLVKLTSLMDEKQEIDWFGSAHKTLRNFCRWQYQHNQESDEHPSHHDTAIFLTKIDLCINKNEINYNEIDRSRRKSSCDTLGLAHSGQICDPESSCAIVEDNGLSAAFTIAHELGHLLGVPHDDEEQCKGYFEQEEFNVMVRMIDSTSHMWSWSSCSKHFITEFLDSNHADCLLDNNSVDIRQSLKEVRMYDSFQRRSFHDFKNWIDRLPGELYSADEQCRLVFGKNSSICFDMPHCKKLWCTTEDSSCRTQHMPWADGTNCGEFGQWCQEGKCVDRTLNLPVDGGWGDWDPWTECSLSCGGGIRTSKRECNNPSPKFGGKFCLGERIKYESCNLEPCPYQSKNEDARVKQCSEFNNHNVTWTPKYTGVPTSDLCALYCESNTGESHKFKSRVIDGTPCSPDLYDICVNGKCLSAGCDRILGSTVRTDYCGVCGGDNSTCREISGQFNPTTVPHGYTFVLTIPPGATNVEITKKTSNASDNWLALRGEQGNYLLNGHYTVNVYERKWYYGGTTVDYSGTKKQGSERINISHPIQNFLHLEVLCVGELQAPIINYHYVVTSDNEYVSYQWFIDAEWTQCNRACNGEQSRRPFCVAVVRPSWPIENFMVNEIKVNDEYCEALQTKPDTEYRVCNVHCELEWHIYQTSACSAKCGHGLRYRLINCTQSFINHNDRIYIDDNYCSHIGPKPPENENCIGNECPVTYQWQYSEWSSCATRQTCGTGKQNREAHCISTTYLDSDPLNVIHTKVDQNLCQQHLTEPIIVQTCQVECPRWNVNSWSECSGTCEQSEQTRTVTCVHGDQQVIDAYCESLETKPIERMHCELSNCLSTNNFQQIDSKNYHNSAKNYQELNLNDYNHHFQGTWQSGDWSSCHVFDLIKIHLDKLLNNFDVPNCFESMKQMNQFQKQFDDLFNLNESLHSNSYAKIVSLLNLNESDFIRRRYVACVLPNGNISNTECDQKLRPESEDKCLLNESIILKSIPIFTMPKLCSTNSINVIPFESETKTNTNFDDFNHYQITEQIKWTPSDWSKCYCDSKRKKFIRKRAIVCVLIDDGQAINDDYCLQHQLTKPNDIEECRYSAAKSEYFQNLDCESNYQMSQTFQNDDFFSQNLTTKRLNNHLPSSELLPSHSYYYSDQVKYTPSLTISTSKTTLAYTPTTLPISESITVLPTVSKDFVPNDSSRSLLYNLPVTQDHSLFSNSILDDYLQSSISDASIISAKNQISHLNGGWTEWSNWNECSVSCGQGVQSREPICPKNNCDPRLKPKPEYRSCYHMCKFFQWHFSEWSSCTTTCTENNECTCSRTRTAECRDWTGFPIPNKFCDNTLLNVKERCKSTAACKLIWRTGQWSECSKSCGIGVQTRTVNCHRINNHGFIDPEPLDHPNFILRKKRRQHFRMKAHRTKNRRMKVVKRQSFVNGWCNMKHKPANTQTCNLGNCLQLHDTDAYIWRPSEWNMCSAPCGAGYQRRKLYCFSQRHNHRVHRYKCNSKLKPERRRKCYLRSCEVISCQDRRDRARIRTDGEYELWIQGARIRVYCFGMAFMPKPLEYLVLSDATYEDNYSELKVESNDCSFYSARSNEPKKSIIYFKYVRFDITSMTIFANDTRFSMDREQLNTQMHNQYSIGYGQAFIKGCPLTTPANDHSNSINCYFGLNKNEINHQPKFSINLRNTGLVVDYNQWIITGNDYDLMERNIEISKNGEKVIGHCGFMADRLPISMPSNPDCLIGCKPINNLIKVRIS